MVGDTTTFYSLCMWCSYKVDDEMVCREGGYPTLQLNKLRNMTANLLKQIHKDTVSEPPLQPLSGENFNQNSKT